MPARTRRARRRSGVARSALRGARYREWRARAAADQGLSFGHPHFSSATTTSGARIRRRLTVALCGDPRGGRPHAPNQPLRLRRRRTAQRWRESGSLVRPAYKGSNGLAIRDGATRTFRRSPRSSSSIQTRARSLGSFHARACGRRRRRRKGAELAAVHARFGGAPRDGRCSRATASSTSSTSRAGRASTQPVYDLDVERTHNFIANGLVTHNSIYAFRGADIRQHPRVRARLPEHEGDPARAELPLDEHDPAGGEPRHLAQPRAQGEEPLVRAR